MFYLKYIACLKKWNLLLHLWINHVLKMNYSIILWEWPGFAPDVKYVVEDEKKTIFPSLFFYCFQ